MNWFGQRLKIGSYDHSPSHLLAGVLSEYLESGFEADKFFVRRLTRMRVSD